MTIPLYSIAFTPSKLWPTRSTNYGSRLSKRNSTQAVSIVPSPIAADSTYSMSGASGPIDYFRRRLAYLEKSSQLVKNSTAAADAMTWIELISNRTSLYPQLTNDGQEDVVVAWVAGSEGLQLSVEEAGHVEVRFHLKGNSWVEELDLAKERRERTLTKVLADLTAAADSANPSWRNLFSGE